MAPALTEPLSPTEKSSKSEATSVPLTRSTRRSRAAAAAAAEAALVDKATTPPPATKTTTNTVGNKERKTRNNSTTTATTTTAISVTSKTTALKVSTTRVTRSKDNANQRLSEQAAIPAESNNPLATTSNSNIGNSTKNNSSIKIQKEPMGLSAALDTSNNNNNNDDPHTSTSSKKDKGNSDSTEKILADLATNIEEAISAEICLRKQLCDVNISNEEVSKKTNGGTELKDIDFVISSNDSPADQEKVEEQQQHMDPVLQSLENNKLDEIIDENVSNEQQEKGKAENIKSNEFENIINNEKTAIIENNENAATNAELDELNEIIENEEQLLKEHADNEEIVETTAAESVNLCLSNNDETTTTETTTPAISTAADEFDDTIEARLSQLDGHGIIAAEATITTTSKTTTTTTDKEISSIKIIPSTIEDDLHDLKAQLELSDTTDETTTGEINESIIQSMDLEQQEQQKEQQHQEQEQETAAVIGGKEKEHFNLESTNINMEIVDGNAELVDQEELVEEVLKVLKGFDPTTANADTLNDLNALFAFSDVYQNINNYDDVNVTTAATTTLASSSSSLNDSTATETAMPLNVTTDNNNSNTSGVSDAGATTVQCNVNWLEDEQQEIVKAQEVIQRKMDFLVRKLRKNQARYMCKHASEEIAGVIEYAVRAANNKLHSAGTPGNSHLMSVISARPPPDVWQEERESPIPSAEVYTLLRKLEISAKAQQATTTKASVSAGTAAGIIFDVATRKSRKSTTSMDLTASAATATATTIPAATATTIPAATTTTPSITPTIPIEANITTVAAASAPPTPTTTTINKDLDSVIPTFDMLAVKEMSQVTGMLQTEMREVQLAIDSDATESSSGCESADELITYNNQIQQPLEIGKRAAWRYARDRAAIAARWSWLLSQISDLDIKIRQHTDLYNDVVRKKGPVIHDNSLNAKMGTTYVKQRQIQQLQQYKYEQQILPLHHQQMQCEQLQQHQLQQLYDNDIIEDDDSGACRTRGYLAKTFRKRKILTTTNLHTISKKAARPTTIKCGCQWPMQPCILCTGRADPTAPRELPNTMTKPERVALLDSGFHPVLSFPDDISHAIHFEAIARLSEWQQRVMRCQVKSIAKSVWKAEKASAKKYDNGNSVKRRYIKKKDRLAAEAAAERDVKAKLTQLSGGSGVAAGEEFSNTTCATTPLVANKRNKMHYQTSLGERMITTTTTTELMEVSQQKNHQMKKDYLAQKYGNYNNNRNPTTTSMISRRNNMNNNNSNNHNNINHRYNNHNRNRKAFSSSSSSSSFSTFHYNNNYSQQQQQYNNNSNYSQQQQQLPVQYNNSNGNSSSSETTTNILHINENWDYMTSMRSRTASPTHANTSLTHKYERSDKKRNSYDIDNIVIPYSVAAATRVEIIPYKEIPTPKWRVISKNNEGDKDMAGYDVETEEEDEEEYKDTKDISCADALKPLEKKEKEEDIQVKEKVQVEVRSLSQAEEEEEKVQAIEKEENDKVENTNNKAEEAHKKEEETNMVGNIKVHEKEEEKTEMENINKKAQEKEEIGAIEKEEEVENIKHQEEEVENKVTEKEEEEAKENIENTNNKAQDKDEEPTARDNVDGPAAKKRKLVESAEKVEEADKTISTQLKVEPNVDVVKEENSLVLLKSEISQESAAKEVKELDIKANEKEKIVAVEDTSKSNVKTECTGQEEEEGEESALNENQHDGDADHDNDDEEQKDIIEKATIIPTTRNYEFHEAVDNPDDIDEEDDEDQVDENISDEIMAKRHERALTEERRKFQTYLKFPWTTRSRANRRGDSRAESSGANTPDPASPAPATVTNTTSTTTITAAKTNPTATIIDVKDQENSISSKATSTQTNTSTNTTTTAQFASVEGNIISTSVTFNNQFAQFTNKDNNNSPNHRTGVRKRRRTTSSKREQETRSLTPDREILPPYEPLKFPLSDEAFDNMVRLLPMDKYTETNINSSTTKIDLCNSVTNMTSNSRKSVLGGFGRGRSGLRRQSTHTPSLPARNNSLRTRLSNRPYVLNSKNSNSSSVQHKTKDQEEFLAFDEDIENIAEKNECKNILRVNGNLLLNTSAAGDMTEETEDETETCEFREAAETDCDDDDDDCDDDDDDDDEEDEEGIMLDDLDDDDDDNDDDGFLATTDYNIHDQIAAAAVIDNNVTSFNTQHDEESTFAAYAGQSDMESSEAEPFQEDDDPNDPEWGNNVRMRKKI